MDFTLSAYKQLILTLQAQDFSFQTFEEYIKNPKEKVVILRHDVDRLPGNSLVIAEIEKEAGIKASYYFRIVKESYDEDIIKQIAKMGHEIGYHYEDMDLSSRGQKSEVRGQKELDDSAVFDKAIKSFERNLEKFRKFYPVKTICMHGSPLSKWDNRDLWKKYDYRDFGIIAEPYFDIDFNEVFYLTDTGRRWDGDSVSVRDKGGGQRTAAYAKLRRAKEVRGQSEKQRDDWMNRMGSLAGTDGRKKKEFKDLSFHSTWDIIEAVENRLLPDKIMINTHPQRWTDNPVEWTKELVWQNVKNVVKGIIIRRFHRLTQMIKKVRR